MKKLLSSLTQLLSVVAPTAITSDEPEPGIPLPLVIWHGLGDNYQADGLRAVGELAKRVNPGTYVYNIHLADDASQDRTASFFGNVTEQLAQVCAALATDPVLKRAPAINGLGFSQGGQFLRGYVERCNRPPVRNLVTFGGQHNGIARFRDCAATDWLCHSAFALLKTNAWSEAVQSRVVPAQYYRDPNDLSQYLEKSNFLADINNERVLKNDTYRRNLRRLRKFAMFLFTDDQTVIPKESGWFAETNLTTGQVTALRDRDLYREDWLGLRALDERGGLDFEAVEGGHMHLTDELLVATFKRYFSLRGSDTAGTTEEL
ncbi:MAG: hypothetical protein M1826_001861 [Phylliscum demangeonii]|nr:MAG: hypothetical protein M1826_001861 [Phylliscum demangeonii]